MEDSQMCVRVYCVMPSKCTEATCPKDLFAAYECCRENSFNVSWVQEEECLAMRPMKEDVFIISKFAGTVFNHLRPFKCTVIGPQCLLVSVDKGEPLPDTQFPVFTVAMKGLVVTGTGLTPREKTEVQEKVHFMGGIYSSSFKCGVTHLVVKTVSDYSEKYQVAISKDVPMMLMKWVDAVWETSSKESCHATDPEFAKYTCPIFLGVVACASQLPHADRNTLKKVLETNGGLYSGQLEMGKTNILITHNAEGDKYTYAKRWKVRCVKPEWVYESLSKGHILNPDNFMVEAKSKIRSSTPERELSHARFGNNSINSTIAMDPGLTRNINETTGFSGTPGRGRPEWLDTLEQMDMSQVAKAGQFLDGCKLFLSGFDGVVAEKLRRIVNSSGATRFNSITDALSHIVMGPTRIDDHWKQIDELGHKPYIVTGEWIVACFRLKNPVGESAYLHPEHEATTSNKQDRPSKTPANKIIRKVAPDDETQFFQQYVVTPGSKSASETPAAPSTNPRIPGSDSRAAKSLEMDEDSQLFQQYATTTDQDESESQPASGLFAGLKFHLRPDDEELETLLRINSGRVVGEKSADYVIVRMEDAAIRDPDPIFVTRGWIDDCVAEEKIVPVQYYHRPAKISPESAAAGILNGCVIAQSGISGHLHHFIVHLCTTMGGRAQDTFSRRTIEERRILACTHLILTKPEGKKYDAAKTWGVAAVDPKWLVDCASRGVRLKETNYPVGCQFPLAEPEEPPEEECPVTQPLTVEPQARSETPKDPSSFKENQDSGSFQPVPTPNLLNNEVQDQDRPLSAVGDFASRFNIATPKSVKEPALDKDRPVWARRFNIATPNTPYGASLKENPSPETRKTFKRILMNQPCWTPNSPEERVALIDDPLLATGREYLSSVAKRCRLDADAATPVLEQHKASQLDNPVNPDTPAPPPADAPPFHSVIAFIHKKLDDRRADLVRAIEILGGSVRWQHCQEVTHFIYQGKVGQAKDVKNAKEWRQKIVAPEWILDSEDAQNLLNEDWYPPTYNAKMTLSISHTPSTKRSQRDPSVSVRSVRPALGSVAEQLGTAEGCSPPLRKAASGAGDWNDDDPPIVAALVNDGAGLVDREDATCKELMQLNEVLSRSSDPDRPAVKAQSASSIRTNRVFVPPTQHVDCAPADSQSAPVTWDLQDTQKPAAPKKPYCIVFSTMDQADRDRNMLIVESLGGVVSRLNCYDPEMTHIVVVKPVRNEKLVSSIAAGKWVLAPAWLECSAKEGRFLDEEPFEWGNPSSGLSSQLAAGSQEVSIATAAYRWRYDRSRGVSKGPFFGFKAILHVRDKTGAFQRLLEAGGGQLVDAVAPYADPAGANICVIDVRVGSNVDMASLAHHGVYCVSTMFLNTLLTAVNKPRWEDSVVPDFKPFLDKMPSTAGSVFDGII